MIKGSCKTEITALRKIADIMRKAEFEHWSTKFPNRQDKEIWGVLTKMRSVYID